MMNHLCLMNEEEMTRHAFDCLATEVNAYTERFIDLSTLDEK